MSDEVRLRWAEVEPLGVVNGELHNVLANVDSLRGAWELSLGQASPGEFAEARRRSLRRHAIETGIIERLYDAGWGVTEALVAEGITAEVAAREGGLDDDALAIIESQYEALQFLAETANDETDLSAHFIRQLHHAICRTQSTYEARNDFGQILQVPLHHGTWKVQPNYARRQDGTLLEYTPPDHVESQMERLFTLYKEADGVHPVARAAWLHHRFIRIHPFEDGNGRVARALTLLVLLRARYAPLVVDRTQRGTYLEALDQANAGDLRDLIRLFARLEIIRTASEVDFFTNLSKGSWWTRLHLVVLGQTLRFVVVIQRVGHGESGVLAVTVFAEAVAPRTSDDDDRPLPTPLFRSTPADSVTLVFSDDPVQRWPEVGELIDRTLAAAVTTFAQQLG